MENIGYENLHPSFVIDVPSISGDSSIDTLCQTYLGDMGTFDNPLTSSLDPPLLSPSSYLSASPYHSSHSSLSSSPCLALDGEAVSGSLLEEMDTFSRIDVSEWRGEDSLDWAGSVCRRKGLDQTTLDLWAFRGVPGESLRRMTLQDFCDLIGSVYGPLFHAEFEDYCRRREEGQRWRHKTGGSSPYSDHGGQFDLTSDLPELDLTSEEIRDLDKYIVGGFQDMDLEGTQSYYDSVDSFPESVTQLSAGPPSPLLTPSSSSSSSFSFSSSSSSSSASSSSSSSSSNLLALPDPLKKIKQDPKKRPRGPKNWEFVIRLLADPRTNPSLIRWEQKEEGTFRLVQPAAIASMWGQRSDRPNLSYDNFARGLRYHYTTGALQPVSEKQLVYRKRTRRKKEEKEEEEEEER